MSPTPEQQRQASDPATPATTLAALAREHPLLRPSIAANPASYAGLLDWLRQYGDAEVQSALDAREREEQLPPPPPPPALDDATSPPSATATTLTDTCADRAPGRRGGFVEPSRSIPLRGLGYAPRYALALVFVGLAGLLSALVVPLAAEQATWSILTDHSQDYRSQGISLTLALCFLSILPSLAMTAATITLPARSNHKLAAVLLAGSPIVLQLLLLLFALVRGPLETDYLTSARALELLTGPAAVAAWFAGRMRPGVSYALLPAALVSTAFSLSVGLANGHDVLDALFSGGYFGIAPFSILFGAVNVAVLVGIAWLGRAIATRTAAPNRVPAAA